MLKNLIELIESKRLEKGMSKSVLARKSGITLNQYYNLLGGKNSRISTVESLLRTLDVKEVKIEL